MWNTARVSGGVIAATVVVVIVVAGLGAIAVQRSRRAFKQAADPRVPDHRADAAARAAAVRLTSTALQALPAPPWRVVHEIAPERLTGAEHVLIGPAGAFAVVTTLEPLPDRPTGEPDAVEVGAAAVTRGGLDDVLTTVELGPCELLYVHWGPGTGTDASVPGVHGVVHADGRHLAAWAAGLPDETLTASQVGLAWQAVARSIGRPDPLE